MPFARVSYHGETDIFLTSHVFPISGIAQHLFMLRCNIQRARFSLSGMALTTNYSLAENLDEESAPLLMMLGGQKPNSLRIIKMLSVLLFFISPHIQHMHIH